MANDEQAARWLDLTDTPYDPLESLRVARGRNILCPVSGRSIFVREYCLQSLFHICSRHLKMQLKLCLCARSLGQR